ncbi:MAG TPA: M56 family metallopeptidase, partial [Gemmatimonadaceae bacterium]
VFVSTDVGPAAFGVLRPRIVLPAWTFELPHAARATIYEHEREHVEANDPALLCLAFFIVTLQPWNVVLWLGRARLRRAIEADCDRRVIGANRRSAEEYARLILSVYERCAVRRVPYMAFASHPSQLEQRLRQMTHRRRRSSIVVAACAGLAIALTVLAWTVSTPDLRAATIDRTSARRPVQAIAVQVPSAAAESSVPAAQSQASATISSVVATPTPQRIRAYGLQLVDSTTRSGTSRQALAAASALAPCRSQGDQASPSPANCEIVGRIVVFAIDSSHILVAYRDPDDTTTGGNAPYAIFGGTPGSIPQIRWRSVGNAAFRDNVLNIESASTGRPAIVIGSHEAEMRAKYPNARAIVVASASVLLRDPGVDWDTLWELPMSLNCLSTYPLASSSQALAHDSTHPPAAPSRGCVVRQGQSLRVVRY